MAEDAIVRMNIQPVANQIVNDLVQGDPRGLGSGYLDPTYRNSMLRGAYLGEATAIADSIIRPTAHIAAQEIALKCKETCGLHAEAFSTAEVLHGPMALVEGRFPVLIFAFTVPKNAGSR